MLTKKLTYIALLLLVCCNTIAAQDSLLLRDYHFIQQSSPWLTQRNAAALTQALYNHKNIAQTELSLSHASGKLTDISGSPSVTSATTTSQAAIWRALSSCKTVCPSTSWRTR